MSAELELAALEASVLDTAEIKGYLARVDEIRAMLGAGTVDADAIRALVLATPAPTVQAQALAAVDTAFSHGVDDALGLVSDLTLPDIVDIAPSAQAKGIVDSLDEHGKQAFATAHKLARAGADPQAVTAPLLAHATSIKGRVAEAVNMAGNEGATAIADAAGLPTVWVAETDACVRCLAYSGHVAQSGGAFPGGLTYGKPVGGPPLKHPPLHRFCRCTVEPLRSDKYAAALRREADRSVLRGFSLESESMGTRVDAADRLLKTDVTAPKSVIAYSRAAVKRGKFTTRGRPPEGPTAPKAKSRPTPPKPPTPPAPKSRPKPRPKTPTGPPTPQLDTLPRGGSASLAAAAAKANPGHGVRAYDNNCSSAVVAAELRVRGLDVTAAIVPGRQGRTNIECAAAWRDGDGNVRPFRYNMRQHEAMAEIESWPEGARGFVSLQWARGRSGHIYSAEKRDGKVVFHEPQQPDAAPGLADDYMRKAAIGKINVLRVDDLKPTDALASFVEPDNAKVRAGLDTKREVKAKMLAEMDGIKAKIDDIDRRKRVLATTTEEKTKRLEMLVERNRLAVEYNALLKRYKR